MITDSVHMIMIDWKYTPAKVKKVTRGLWVGLLSVVIRNCCKQAQIIGAISLIIVMHKFG